MISFSSSHWHQAIVSRRRMANKSSQNRSFVSLFGRSENEKSEKKNNNKADNNSNNKTDSREMWITHDD